MKAISLLISILFSAVVNAQVPDIAWQETFGGTGMDICKAVVQTSDGGYLIGGRSDSNNSFEKTSNSIGGVDFWIIKLNASRQIQLQRTIGGTSDDFLEDIVICSDGGYLLAVNQKSADLRVAHLNPGIYLLNIQTNAGVESHKLVVE